MTPEERELLEAYAAGARRGSADEYLQSQRALAPGSGATDDQRTQAIQARDSFENSHIAGQLNPAMPLMPQALALTPGNTHPGGDPAAQAEFENNPADASKGTVYVYEPPLSAIQKRLLEDPQFAAAAVGGPVDPQRIAQLKTSDHEYQAAADLLWVQTASQAAEGGKKAYRYSKTPWLQDGKAMGTLSSLKTKVAGALQPLGDTATAFILGVDDGAAFGLGRGAMEAANPTASSPNELMGIESTGGIPGGTATERFRLTEEEHPTAHFLGQGLGTLAPWSAANKAMNFVVSGGKKLLGEGASLGARVGLQGAAAGVVGAADEAARQGVDAASSTIRTGEPGTTMDEAAGRILSVGAVSGGLGTVLGGAAEGVQDWVTKGQRFAEAPRRFEQAGGRFEVGRGPVLPEQSAELQARGRREDLLAVDVGARDIAPKLAAGEKANVDAVTTKVKERNAPFYESPEGKQRLPANNVLSKQVELLDANHAPVEGRLQPIGDKGKQVAYLRERLNNEIGGVSLDPVEGAIALDPQQADIYLGPHWKRRVYEQRQTKAPAGGPASPFAPAADLETSPGVVGGRPVPVGTTPEQPELQGLGPSRVVSDPLRPRYGTGFTGPTPGAKVTPDPPIEVGADGATLPSKFRRAPPQEQQLTLGRKFDIPGDSGPRPTDDRKPMPPSREANMRPRSAPATDGPLGDTNSSVEEGALEQALRRRGIAKVYVVPRRYDAHEHEQAIRSYQKLDDPTDPNGRERKQLYIAALKDRDERPMNGVKGAWSAQQRENESMIAAAKDDARMVGEKPADAHRAVANYAEQRPGEAPLVEAVRRAADRAGVREQLDGIRGLSPWMDLQQQLGAGSVAGNVTPGGRVMGASRSNIVNNAALRMLYPLSQRHVMPGVRAGVEGVEQFRAESDEKKKTEEKRP